uniref:Uncharacterized protein n=1 Tax=Arundo donax TaxID=35708 RepID=A0A0A8XXX9_ARUDO
MSRAKRANEPRVFRSALILTIDMSFSDSSFTKGIGLGVAWSHPSLLMSFMKAQIFNQGIQLFGLWLDLL